MKCKLFYLVPLLLVLAAGCAKTTTAPPIPNPSGTYTGQFRLLHRHTNHVPFDTLKSTINITFSAGNAYAVTGDTTVHAGSKGNFAFNSPYMQFVDSTFPVTGAPAKTHLHGLYLYYYDGAVFQLLSYSADTLSLQYDMRRTQ